MTYSWKSNSSLQQKIFRSRIIASIVIIAALFLILLLRLAHLQINLHEKYITLSRENQIRIIPIAPPRGIIYDRNGEVIADNVPAFDLVVVPERVDNKEALFEQLKSLINLTDEEITQANKKYKQARKFDRVPIRLQLSEEDRAKLALNRHLLGATEITATLIRHYPHNELFAHAVGYVGQIDENEAKKLDMVNYKGTNYTGKAGIERSYEEALHGTVGYQEVETDARGRTLRNLNYTPPIPGKSLVLNLDIRIQSKAAQMLQDKQGSVVGIDPRNGEVLVMYSAPSFDPNKFVLGIKSKEYAALRNGIERPLFNRAVQGKYPPASTIKPFMASIGLLYKVITPNFSISDPGYYRLGGVGRAYRDWKEHGHGIVDVHKAVQQSCDTFFYILAQRLGIENMAKGLELYGFGQKTGLDLLEEAKGVLPNDAWKRKTLNQVWYPGETLSAGIGQGYMLVTPVQMAFSTSVIANRGVGYTPSLVQKVGDEPKERTLAPLPKNEIQKRDWDIVEKSMVAVVSEAGGTAFYLNSELKYPMAGKTGTAQVVGISQGAKYDASKLASHLHDHTWFISYAPVSEPDMALAIIVENEKGSPKLAKQIMDVRYETTHTITTQ